jgi:CBS domain-containing protein
MFVSDILASKGGLVYTVTPSTNVGQIARQLTTRRIGSVLVIDRLDRVVGIVSERDIVQAAATHGWPALELEAAEIMTRNVLTCDPDDSIEQIMETMTSNRIRHLPVVQRGELMGVISIGDVVKARLAETSHETEALRAYIVAG